MTTAATQGPTRAPTPRPKATLSAPELTAATAATASASNPLPIQPSGLLSGSGRRGGGAAGATAGAPADGLSDRATASLIRRTLCPQQLVDKAKNTTPAPIEDLLPPLTSRNDVDLQLYALIAIILREFVQNWYSKITPDETFVAEIVQIIAHCTRALEQRLRKVDLESLLLDELPDLLDRHITAYRTAHDPVAQPPVVTDPREIYHSLYPLPALSPVPRPSNPDSVAQQAENEVAYRQLLVHAVLPVLLPTEDLENECLTALVGQIFSELIIGNVFAHKLSEPWLLWEVIIIGAGVIGRRRAAGRPAAPGPGAGPSSRGSKDGRRGFSIQALFWTVLQWGFVAASLLRAIVAMLITSRTIPRRASRNAPVLDEHEYDDHALGAAAAHHRPDTKLDPMQAADSYETETNTEPPKTPVLAFRLWAALSNLAELDVRMPWLCGTLSILQWIAMTGPGRMANVDGVIDRLLSYGIHQYLLDPANLPPLLRNVRGALFPNNIPGKPTLMAPSSEAELLLLRRRCASALWALVPKGVGRLYFGSSRSGSHGAGAGARGRGAAVGNEEGWDPATPAPAAASASGPARLLPPKGSARQHGQQQHGHGSSASSSPDQDVATALPSQRSAPRSGGQPSTTSTADQTSAATIPAALRTSTTDASAAAVAVIKGQEAEVVGAAQDGEWALQDIEAGILDVFSDAYCNKHLMYSVVELLLVRLLPEIAENGVVNLWAERLA